MKLKNSLAIMIISLLFANLATASAAMPITLSEANNLQMISIKVGTQLSLILHSKYWMITQPNRNGPLQLEGSGTPPLGTPNPSPRTPGCRVIGSGCGTQKWVFVATTIGVVVLRANRTTCGEAMRCTELTSQFKVTVKVVA